MGVRFAAHVRVTDWEEVEPLSFGFFKAERGVVGIGG